MRRQGCFQSYLLFTTSVQIKPPPMPRKQFACATHRPVPHAALFHTTALTTQPGPSASRQRLSCINHRCTTTSNHLSPSQHSQTQHSQSQQPMLPQTASAVAPSPCPLRPPMIYLRSDGSSTSAVRRVQSAPPLAASPAASQAQHSALSEWPPRVCRGMGALRSHSFRVWSYEADSR